MAALRHRTGYTCCGLSSQSSPTIKQHDCWRLPTCVSQDASHAPGVSRPSTLAFGGTSLSFASRANEHFFRLPAAPFSFMQAPLSFQARFGTAPSAQPLGRSTPSAPGRNVFTTLTLSSAFASTTVSASHAACSAFPQTIPGLLLLLIGPKAQMAPDRTTQAPRFTGQHLDVFTSWSHPAFATDQSPLTETTEVFLEEGPSSHGNPLTFKGPSAQGPSTVFPLAPLIDFQIFATMQFEGPPLLYTRALHAALEEISYLLKERLPTA